MKTTVKTIKGWANNSNLIFNQNTNNDTFQSNLEKYIDKNLKGYIQLNTSFDTLRGKNAKHKVIIKGYYWRGAWANATKETVTVFYK